MLFRSGDDNHIYKAVENKFQFQLGAIGSTAKVCAMEVYDSFNSSLVRLGDFSLSTDLRRNSCFNSSLVRLGASALHPVKSVVKEFQFQLGAIGSVANRIP